MLILTATCFSVRNILHHLKDVGYEAYIMASAVTYSVLPYPVSTS